MATEDPMRIIAGSGIRGSLGMAESVRSSSGTALDSASSHDSVAQELGMLLRSHSKLDNILNKRDAVIHRSDSAPPSVEGSFASLGGFLNGQFSASGSRDSSEIIDSEQELRSDPAYLAFYYSHVNLNPRLPPPLITRENYHLAQRIATGSLGDKRKLRSFDDSNSRSLFSSQPMLPTHTEEPEFPEDEKSSAGGLIKQAWSELSGDTSAYGNKPKTLVDLIQEDFPRTPSPVFNQLRPPSRVATEEVSDGGSSLEGSLNHLRESSISSADMAELNAVLLGAQLASSNGVLGSRSARPNPAVGSRSATPNPSLVHMAGSSSGLSGPIARRPTPEPDTSILTGGSNIKLGGPFSASSSGVGAADISASLKSLSLSSEKEIHSQQQDIGDGNSLGLAHASQLNNRSQVQTQLQVPQVLQQQRLEPSSRPQAKYGHSGPSSVQSAHLQSGNSNNVYAAAAAAAAMSYMAANPYYQGLQAYATPYGPGGYTMNPALMPTMLASYPSSMGYDTTTAAAAAAAAVAAGIGAKPPSSGTSNPSGFDMQQLYKYAAQAGATSQSHLQEPSLYYHYLQQYAMENARNALSLNDPSLVGGYHMDSLEMQKSQMFGYPIDQKNQFSRGSSYGMPMVNKSSSHSPTYFGSPPGVGFMMPYGSSPISSPVLPGSPLVPGALSLRHADRNVRFPSGAGRSTPGGAYMGWQSQKTNDIGEEPKGSSLLEELKNNKTRRFELADIAGHVVEFSSDQHGSRFIQQKLETVSMEEKASVFQEVLPHALSLMTDVFGNYVIQKFFEHGSPDQRAELAEQLVGHVLELSLQMYGCRVIQKALEVIDMEQQIRLISELNGHVMRCVRDQNGNHVIQKCIECVNPDHINFILSAFHGQVAVLSTHPYGCRVIQRVLEHCTEDQKQDGIMEEILRSVCTLAQDQYGNYVIQHILEHGKPEERSEILTKMAGQIVKMSQHKFASNVVEKCLEFGGPEERQILITEMLGLTDENEPLQAMMKDQYANYVVQKVLETCDDQQREMLLSRIRVHLHALKKYTYGKHIVARVEKLVAAGERRGAIASAT